MEQNDSGQIYGKIALVQSEDQVRSEDEVFPDKMFPTSGTGAVSSDGQT